MPCSFSTRKPVYGPLPFCKHFNSAVYRYDCIRISGLSMGLMALAIMAYSRACSSSPGRTFKHRGFLRFCKRRFDRSPSEMLLRNRCGLLLYFNPLGDESLLSCSSGFTQPTTQTLSVGNPCFLSVKPRLFEHSCSLKRLQQYFCFAAHSAFVASDCVDPLCHLLL